MPPTHTTSLGNFSISLAVKDLAASRAFYEKLGFQMFAGDNRRWVILQNGGATIGLHQGAFERNILTLTFNPAGTAHATRSPSSPRCASSSAACARRASSR